MNCALPPVPWSFLALGLPGLLGGCLLVSAVEAPVKVAATTVVVAGETAGTVVKTTGKIARAALNAGGTVSSAGLEGAAQLSQAGMVTFADAASGAIVRVPWKQGLTLTQARNLAGVSLARQAVDLVRAGEIVYAATRYSDVPVPVGCGRRRAGDAGKVAAAFGRDSF